MEQHPLPRQITTFEFKLIGFMTLKQFMYIAVGSGVAYITYALFPIPFINIMLAVLVFAAAGAFAFLPIMDRPMEIWIKNLIKRIQSPTQYFYQKQNEPLYFLKDLYFLADPHHMLAHIESKEKLAKYLSMTRQRPKPNYRKREIGQLMQEPSNALKQNIVPSNVVAAMAEQQTPAPATTPPTLYVTPAAAPVPTAQPMAPVVAPAAPVVVPPAAITMDETQAGEPSRGKQESIIEAPVVPSVAPEPMTVAAPPVSVAPVIPTPQVVPPAPPEGTPAPETPKPVVETPPSAPHITVEPPAPSPLKPYMQTHVINEPPAVSTPSMAPPIRVQAPHKPVPTVTSPSEPFLMGIIKTAKRIPLPGVMVYMKDVAGNPVRLMKTNPHGVFATFNPVSPGTYVLEVRDPNGTYYFDTMNIAVRDTNPMPVEVLSKEIL